LANLIAKLVGNFLLVGGTLGQQGFRVSLSETLKKRSLLRSERKARSVSCSSSQSEAYHEAKP